MTPPQPFPAPRATRTDAEVFAIRSLAERIIECPENFGIQPWQNLRRIVFGNCADGISWADVCGLIPDCTLN